MSNAPSWFASLRTKGSRGLWSKKKAPMSATVPSGSSGLAGLPVSMHGEVGCSWKSSASGSTNNGSSKMLPIAVQPGSSGARPCLTTVLIQRDDFHFIRDAVLEYDDVRQWPLVRVYGLEGELIVRIRQ